ncbi:MAG TPA: hypothetical protein VIL05_09540 [Thermoclostridium sp.]
MIKHIEEKHINECVEVIKDSFLTVAKEFGIMLRNRERARLTGPVVTLYGILRRLNIRCNHNHSCFQIFFFF